MKKFLIFLCAVTLVFGMVGTASATLFSHTNNLNVILGRYPQADNGVYDWTHYTPSDFQVPYDTVNSATIEIFAERVNSTNDTVEVAGWIRGYIENQVWTWDIPDSTWIASGSTFNVEDIFSPTWNASSFQVSLNYIEVGPNNYLHLIDSIFTIDYNNETNNNPVPEPSTILLLGSGLLGLVGYNRKRFSKKS